MDLIAQYGLTLVFVNVLLERAGLPLPATPTLLVCGAFAASGRLSPWSIFGLALLGMASTPMVLRWGRRHERW